MEIEKENDETSRAEHSKPEICMSKYENANKEKVKNENVTKNGIKKRDEESSFIRSLKPKVREFKRTIYMFRQSFLAMAGLSIVIFYLIVAALAPVLAPPEENQKDVYQRKVHYDEMHKDPSPEHPFGTDSMGCDVYYGVIWGTHISILMGTVIVGITVLIGSILGAMAGYFGGKLDDILMRITDVFLSLPSLILAMAIVVSLGRTLENIMFALIIVWWPAYTRIVRGQALAVRENKYVEAARAVGASEARIVWKHILPNCISPIIIQATMDFGSVVLTAAALSFIGFSYAGATTTEWGMMVSAGCRDITSGQWWTATFPGLAIFFFVLGFNLFGDGLRDLLDPRLRR